MLWYGMILICGWNYDNEEYKYVDDIMIEEYYKYTGEIMIEKYYIFIENVIVEKDTNRWMSLWEIIIQICG